MSWYDEVKMYDFNNPDITSMNTGHFTQMIWNASTHVGFGLGISPDGLTFYGINKLIRLSFIFCKGF